ncbi:MAG: TRASH domain-containing protein [Sulfolobales archaeon]|nr:TRASH domain-containing protein [Sulfolobales archaeon]
MPFVLDSEERFERCDWCGSVIKGKPIVVKTCCSNKPRAFCSQRCYDSWKREWLRAQEQLRRRSLR